jgi:hypothetical protein
MKYLAKLEPDRWVSDIAKVTPIKDHAQIFDTFSEAEIAIYICRDRFGLRLPGACVVEMTRCVVELEEGAWIGVGKHYIVSSLGAAKKFNVPEEAHRELSWFRRDLGCLPHASVVPIKEEG